MCIPFWAFLCGCKIGIYLQTSILISDQSASRLSCLMRLALFRDGCSWSPSLCPVKSNVVFTDSYLKEIFHTQYFPKQMETVPKDGAVVKVGKEKLKWHALDSKLFNVKLFRFATSFKKPKYGVLFWAVTIIDCPEEMKDVRLSVGSNGASMWWLNGEEAVMLEGDRRMVRDDVVSKKLTLKKGRNILRGAVINGPGMSDFCVRFIDGQGKPVRNLSIHVK